MDYMKGLFRDADFEKGRFNAELSQISYNKPSSNLLLRISKSHLVRNSFLENNCNVIPGPVMPGDFDSGALSLERFIRNFEF